ncbi:protein of unknown function [Saccharicrinis carchari]|uniref:DUF4834 domain-containing protein n=1 Tax=Saccharicrinis carchari TaxID=1168039 RepID=A0A521CQS8_SACCC|nr:DUF4834 family protein [Saccharicrinis carchari]SMO61776.1 protein of unknown function [Saccharicrinis carchari]
MGLLKTIFFILVFYYLFRFIARVIVPFLLGRQMNKMNNHYKREQSFKTQKKREEGKVTIQKKHKSPKKVSPDVGEYIDYEEVKD